MIGRMQMLGSSGGKQNSILIVGRTRIPFGDRWGMDSEILSNLLSGIG